MKAIQLFFLACLLLLTSTVTAQNKIEFVEYDLPNGLHVILGLGTK